MASRVLVKLLSYFWESMTRLSCSATKGTNWSRTAEMRASAITGTKRESNTGNLEFLNDKSDFARLTQLYVYYVIPCQNILEKAKEIISFCYPIFYQKYKKDLRF